MRAATRSRRLPCILADVAQPVELLFCKQEVRGSSPLVSSNAIGQVFDSGRCGRMLLFRPYDFLEGCPSGQWERAVNPPAYAYGGSNPPPSTDQQETPIDGNGSINRSGWQAGSDGAIGRAPFCGSSSVGRASAFQAERRGFESRLPLRSQYEDVKATQDWRLVSAHLAQMVERVLGKDEVTSSILVVGSKRLVKKFEAIT
jgi:hypothetical protein